MRAFDLSPLFRSTVGFDRLFDMLDSAPQFDAGQGGYPPYNIERLGETHYRITLAVAGFAEKDLDAEVREGVLTVQGKHTDEEEAEAAYLHRGIAGRAFERRFQLAENVEVKGARLENGLLHLELKRELPESKKPRTIQINGGTQQTIEDQSVN